MNSGCVLILSLAVFGASAAPLGVIGGCNTGCASAIPGTTTFAQTPVIENGAHFIPSILPTTSVSKSCHCLKTVVRPQIRNEVITVPTVDRLVRYVPSPVVDVVSVNCAPTARQVDIPTCGDSLVGGVVGNGIVGSGVVGTGLVGSGVVGTGLVGSGVVGTGLVGSGVVGTGLVGSGCVGTGLVGSGVVGTGLVGSGVVGTGLVGSGCVGTGLVGSGVVGTGLVGSGVVGTGLVGSGIVNSVGCGGNIVV